MAERHWLYCVTRAGCEPPEGTAGIGGAGVFVVDDGEHALWASRLGDRSPRSIDGVRCHNAVVMAAMAGGVTPVPLRFGQVVDAEELPAVLEAHRLEWRKRLDEFAGTLELGVRLDGGDYRVPSADAASGRQFMEALLRRRREALEAVALVRRQVSAYVLREHLQLPERGRDFTGVAHLIRRERTEMYRRSLDELTACLPHFRLTISGPWPPYSFAA